MISIFSSTFNVRSTFCERLIMACGNCVMDRLEIKIILPVYVKRFGTSSSSLDVFQLITRTFLSSNAAFNKLEPKGSRNTWSASSRIRILSLNSYSVSYRAFGVEKPRITMKSPAGCSGISSFNPSDLSVLITAVVLPIPPDPVNTKELMEPLASILTNFVIKSKRSTTEKGHFGASTVGWNVTVGFRYLVVVTGPFF